MSLFVHQPPRYLLRLQRVEKHYRLASKTVSVLRNVSLRLEQGETCAIRGSSGSGKSTLLNLLGLLDRPSRGEMIFAGHDVSRTDVNELARLRNREIGFVFQSFHLLPRLSALDNVALPLSYRGISRAVAREQALQQLLRVGLGDHAGHRPAQLSGGQRQRVAIARALVGKPSLILADEPTGNLDPQTADDILQLLLDLNRQQAVTLVMVTHDAALAERFQRQLRVEDGELSEARRG